MHASECLSYLMCSPSTVSVRGISVHRELGLYLCCQEESNSTLSPVVQADIMPSINIQCNIIQSLLIFMSADLSVS